MRSTRGSLPTSYQKELDTKDERNVRGMQVDMRYDTGSSCTWSSALLLLTIFKAIADTSLGLLG